MSFIDAASQLVAASTLKLVRVRQLNWSLVDLLVDCDATRYKS